MMKKYASFLSGSLALLATILLSVSANAQPPQAAQQGPMGMPPVPELTEEYKADLNRELQPRGEKIGLLIVSHGAGVQSWSDLVEEITEKVRALDEKDRVFAVSRRPVATRSLSCPRLSIQRVTFSLTS